MSINMNSILRHDLLSAELNFRKACQQVFVLNQQVEQTTTRYNEADAAENKVLRYNIRLRLSVLEGVRNMFYEYAAKKAADIVDLQNRVLESDSFISDDDSDSDLSEITFGYSYGSDDSDYVIAEDSLEFC